MSAPKMTARDLSKNSTVVDELPIPEPYVLGQYVRVNGLHGFWKIIRATKDGGITVYGGASGRQSTRTFLLDRIRPATRAELRKAGLS